MVGELRTPRLTFAYADPPYLGMCGRYEHFHPDGRCWDEPETHRLLIERLAKFDGWALSLSAPSLFTLLPWCPTARVCAWVKPFAAFKKNVTQAFAWEPVIIFPLRSRSVEDPTIRDWVATPITLETGTIGAKPEAFARWLFEFVGLEPDDEFTDLFPGSGAITRAHRKWTAQAPLGLLTEAG